jgi:hypothetical protein
MSTITLDNENIESDRVGVVFDRIFNRIFQFVRSIFSAREAAAEDSAAFKTAVSAVKLAAEPGENYAVVAARIQREVAIYRDFLLHPKPIGKISLIVKEIDPNSPDFRSPRKQYQVHDPSEGHRDPAEGWASVGYKFNRSATKVLEFMVYDMKGSPLFAIARTYSSWLGATEFKLGLNRVFFLNMVEDSPGYVQVHAGFRATARQSAGDRQAIPVTVRQHPSATVKPDSGQSILDLRPFGRRLAYMFVLQCLVISLICSTVIWVGTGRAMSRTASLFTKTEDGPASETLGSAPLDTLTVEEMAIYDTAGGTVTNAHDTPNETRRKIASRLAQKAQRLAGVKGFSISVNNASCQSGESRCFELLSTIQKGVLSTLKSLSLRVYTDNQTKDGVEPAQLMVSYNPIDTLHGQVHLTLSDQQGELWDNKGNFSYAAITEPSVVNSYCEEASSEILWEIITAKIQVKSNPEEKAEKAEGSKDAAVKEEKR